MTNNDLTKLSLEQLKRAIAIREEIEGLENELQQILGAAPAEPVAEAKPKKRTVSAATRAKLAAAQRARRAAQKEVAMVSPRARKNKGKMSPEVRAKIAAAMQARWARIRMEKKA